MPSPAGLAISRLTVIVSIFTIVAACVNGKPRSTLRGELAWDRTPYIVTECGTGEVVRLGPMASALPLRFSRRARELADAGGETILVELRGERMAASSSDRRRGAGGALYQWWTVSMKRGTCG